MPISHKKPPGQARGHRKQNVVVLADELPPVPDPPAGLLKPSRDRWAAFWASQVARAVDLHSDLPRLVRWIQAADEYDRVAKVCKQSRLLKGSMGQPVLNPLFAYLSQLDSQITRAETEFGMTPMARLRLGIAVGEAQLVRDRVERSSETQDRRQQVRDRIRAVE